MQVVTQLYDLQEIDLKASAAEGSLADVRTKLADDSALISASASTQQLHSQIEELEIRRRAVEGTIADLQERLQKVESRLYSGAITSARALEAAEEERDFIAGEQRTAEDQLLELMVEIEEAESAETVAQESLARLESDRPAETAELREAEERLTGELAGLAGDREQIVPQLPAQTLSLYESLRKIRAGRAVAKVERGACQGCRLALSTMELQRARSSQGIVQCGSCDRILYVV